MSVYACNQPNPFQGGEGTFSGLGTWGRGPYYAMTHYTRGGMGGLGVVAQNAPGGASNAPASGGGSQPNCGVVGKPPCTTTYQDIMTGITTVADATANIITAVRTSPNPSPPAPDVPELTEPMPAAAPNPLVTFFTSGAGIAIIAGGALLIGLLVFMGRRTSANPRRRRRRRRNRRGRRR